MVVVFFGTSDYCLPVLEALHKNFDLKLVVTRPDKPVGRKKTLTPSATKTWAQEHDVPVTTPTTLKKDTQDRLTLLTTLSGLKPDLAVVSDYGLIIPEAIFSSPRLSTINIHFSRLPYLRGPSPVQYTLLRGDTRAWITIFKLENPPELPIKMDSGPILSQKSYPIKPNDTAASLYSRLFKEAAKILPEVISDYSLHSSDPTFLRAQDHSQATFCQFLTREDGFVKQEKLQISKPTSEAAEIYHQWQAMTPWPGLWTIVPGEVKGPHRMKILKCHLENNKLILDQIQFEGEKPKNGPQLNDPLQKRIYRPDR